MKIVTSTCFCDICSHVDATTYNLQVIFTTEQTEGRSVTPYLSNQNIDICKECYASVLKGNYVFAHGAMGHNTYYFRAPPSIKK